LINCFITLFCTSTFSLRFHSSFLNSEFALFCPLSMAFTQPLSERFFACIWKACTLNLSCMHCLTLISLIPFSGLSVCPFTFGPAADLIHFQVPSFSAWRSKFLSLELCWKPSIYSWKYLIFLHRYENFDFILIWIRNLNFESLLETFHHAPFDCSTFQIDFWVKKKLLNFETLKFWKTIFYHCD
jgi:hypothetical protein